MQRTTAMIPALYASFALLLAAGGCLRDSGSADSVGTDDVNGASDLLNPDNAPDDAFDTGSETQPADQLGIDQAGQDESSPDLVDTQSDGSSDDALEETQPEVVLPPCAPGPACTAIASSDCLALVDNSDKQDFGLRFASFVPTQPAALTTGIVSQVLQNSTTASLAACNLMGTGTISVLLKFSGNQVTFGGAAPVADPAMGYAFYNQMANGINVAPQTADFETVPDGIQTKPVDLVLPLFLDSSASQLILLPLKGAVIEAKLSPDQNCIGAYNAEGLDPANSCMPDPTHPQFLPGGILTAAITLEDADTIVVEPLAQSLCVVLGGTPTPEPGLKLCARDANGAILFKGDWCSTTNSAGGCGDAVLMKVEFAASGVKLL